MWLRWQAAVVIALTLGAFGAYARTHTSRGFVIAGSFARETALVLALYSVWQIAGRVSVMHVDGALSRGDSIWDLERTLHLPSEAGLQHAVLPYPRVVQAANSYYAIAHVPALVIFLLWLFVRHRHRYPAVRNTLAIATGAALAIQLIPVAPPRMFGNLGFTDTALRYGQSVYGRLGAGMADQLSAMPSVHVLLAVLIGVSVVLASASRWRWLVLAHPVVTVLVVTVTANHWWMDGIAAVALLPVAFAIQLGFGNAGARFRARLALRRPATAPEPA
jgi:hypothetical protein